MVRVVIADDDRLLRQGLGLVVARATDIEIVGEARNGHEAIALAEQLNPDVICMDLDMPRMSGFKAAAQIHVRKAGIRIVIVSSKWDEEALKQALQNGATGYVAKIEIFEEIIPAIRAASKGKSYFSASILKVIAEAGIGGVSRTLYRSPGQ